MFNSISTSQRTLLFNVGTIPLVFSLLGDLYEPHQRAGVSAAVQVATGAGLAVGQGVSGFLGDFTVHVHVLKSVVKTNSGKKAHFWFVYIYMPYLYVVLSACLPSRCLAGPVVGWRWPFVVVAIPAIAMAFLMPFTTEEPQRGVTEAALREHWSEAGEFVYDERITWAKLGHLLRTPTNVLVIAQGLPGCLPWGMLLTFLNDYLAQNKGLAVSTATTVVLAVGIGGAIGVIGGGLLGQWLYNRCGKWSMSVFVGVCTLCGALPMWYVINADVANSMGLAYAMAMITGVMSSTVGPNMRAMMMNVNEPETRGVALALQTMLDDLGKGLGPAIVAIIISHVGRTAAFNISIAGWVPCGLLLLGTAATLEKDEIAMQHRLKTTLSKLSLASSSRRASVADLANV